LVYSETPGTIKTSGKEKKIQKDPGFYPKESCVREPSLHGGQSVRRPTGRELRGGEPDWNKISWKKVRSGTLLYRNHQGHKMQNVSGHDLGAKRHHYIGVKAYGAVPC